MVEGHRLTGAREAVEQLLQSEHADVLRERVGVGGQGVEGSRGRRADRRRARRQRLEAASRSSTANGHRWPSPFRPSGRGTSRRSSGATVAGTLVTAFCPTRSYNNART